MLVALYPVVHVKVGTCEANVTYYFDDYNRDPTELINQVALLRNSGLVPSTASVPLPCHATIIQYIQYLLTHVVDMLYIDNSWNLKEFNNEQIKRKNSTRLRKSPNCISVHPSNHVGRLML